MKKLLVTCFLLFSSLVFGANQLPLVVTNGQVKQIPSGDTVAGSLINGNISGNAANVTGTVAVGNGGTGSTSLTSNNVLLGNGSSALQTVAPGTSGNVLTSNGSTWQSTALPASTSALTLVSSTTCTSGANCDALSAFTSTYDNYLIIAEGFLPSADDDMLLQFAVSGSADTGSNYYSATLASSTTTSADSKIFITAGTGVLAAGKGLNFNALIINANSTSKIKSMYSDAISQSLSITPTFNFRATNTAYIAANAITGIRLTWSSASNFSAGTLKIYGYSN